MIKWSNKSNITPKETETNGEILLALIFARRIYKAFAKIDSPKKRRDDDGGVGNC